MLIVTAGIGLNYAGRAVGTTLSLNPDGTYYDYIPLGTATLTPGVWSVQRTTGGLSLDSNFILLGPAEVFYSIPAWDYVETILLTPSNRLISGLDLGFKVLSGPAVISVSSKLPPWKFANDSLNRNVTVTGTMATVTGNGRYGPKSSVTISASPEAGKNIVSAVIGGVDCLAEILSGGYTFTMPDTDVTGAIVASSSTHTITGSYTSQGANGCNLSPYANLGNGNVLIQPRAFIFANGSIISNGETVEVESGESVMIGVSTEAIYTRLVSVVVNGQEYAGSGTNASSLSISRTADSDITVSVVVAADRFCYQAGGGGGGTGGGGGGGSGSGGVTFPPIPPTGGGFRRSIRLR